MAELETPVLLIAMPQVLDPYFHKSVVLLVHHDDEGSVGFIVNHPTSIAVRDILEGMEMPWQGAEGTVAFFGGPVQPQLGSVLFRSEELEKTSGATPVFDDLAISQHVNDLSRLAGEPPSEFRLLLGYAGWGAEQLIEEILRNDWITAPCRRELLFSEDSEMGWEAAVKAAGVDPSLLPSWTENPGDTAN